MRFLAALQFLTIIPLPWRHQVSPEDLVRSTGYFPVVGLIIGLLLAGLNWLLGWFLPIAVVHVLLIVFLAVISGALHLDGLADTCDGISGGKTLEERWRVMQDSRVGSFGIVGVCCLLLVKYVSLNNVPQSLVMTSLVLMPVISRWAMVYAIFIYPYAKPLGLGKVFKQGANWLKFVMATLIALVVAATLARLAGLAIILAIIPGVWVIVVIMATYLKRKFSGLTGDTYGAINEVAEVGVLLLICLLAQVGLVT
ncbi:MAG: adenosylcobinamide-GDP ribazoletransferase [Dehalococcoidales bacterium]